MISALMDEIRGFGFSLTNEEMRNLGEGATPLHKNFAGIKEFEYGKNNEGYWNNDTFIKQLQEFLPIFESLYPNTQLVLEVDHSSGHLKSREDGLNAERMNLKWGGKQPILRDTQLTSDCLGDQRDFEVTIRENGNPPRIIKYVYKKMNLGEVQSMVFKDTDLPPFNEPTVPKYDKEITAQQKTEYKARKLAEDPNKQFSQEDFIIPGYVGKPKGMAQVLLERGLYTPGMTKDQAKAALSKCGDFKNEMSALETFLVDRGHLLLISPKCHPELAGCGIEYMFGKIKWTFRRHTNDTVAANLSNNVYQAITMVSNVERCWRFQRTTRTYRRMYFDLHQNNYVGADSYEGLEEMVKKYTTHRNIGEICHNYIQST
jgi:hypothetical protein